MTATIDLVALVSILQAVFLIWLVSRHRKLCLEFMK